MGAKHLFTFVWAVCSCMCMRSLSHSIYQSPLSEIITHMRSKSIKWVDTLSSSPVWNWFDLLLEWNVWSFIFIYRVCLLFMRWHDIYQRTTLLLLNNRPRFSRTENDLTASTKCRWKIITLSYIFREACKTGDAVYFIMPICCCNYQPCYCSAAQHSTSYHITSQPSSNLRQAFAKWMILQCKFGACVPDMNTDKRSNRQMPTWFSWASVQDDFLHSVEAHNTKIPLKNPKADYELCTLL